jgi:hypothetical protein
MKSVTAYLLFRIKDKNEFGADRKLIKTLGNVNTILDCLNEDLQYYKYTINDLNEENK